MTWALIRRIPGAPVRGVFSDALESNCPEDKNPPFTHKPS
jgi:hypothetical protein